MLDIRKFMKKAIIVYWSGTGNTEALAESIKEGLENSNFQVELTEVYDTSVEEVISYDKILFGCPSMGIEELEEEEFEPFFQDIEESLEGKKVALFGSYGWGDGEWMEAWEERVNNAGAILFEKGYIVESTPSEEEEEEAKEFGGRFADF